jgi:hypothetical protein
MMYDIGALVVLPQARQTKPDFCPVTEKPGRAQAGQVDSNFFIKSRVACTIIACRVGLQKARWSFSAYTKPVSDRP